MKAQCFMDDGVEIRQLRSELVPRWIISCELCKQFFA